MKFRFPPLCPLSRLWKRKLRPLSLLQARVDALSNRVDLLLRNLFPPDACNTLAVDPLAATGGLVKVDFEEGSDRVFITTLCRRVLETTRESMARVGICQSTALCLSTTQLVFCMLSYAQSNVALSPGNVAQLTAAGVCLELLQDEVVYILINVGGVRYLVPRELLMSRFAYFDSLLERWANAKNGGEIFVDRIGDYFGDVLDHAFGDRESDYVLTSVQEELLFYGYRADERVIPSASDIREAYVKRQTLMDVEELWKLYEKRLVSMHKDILQGHLRTVYRDVSQLLYIYEVTPSAEADRIEIEDRFRKLGYTVVCWTAGSIALKLYTNTN